MSSFKIVWIITLLTLLMSVLMADTLGLVSYDPLNSYDGYTLFSPNNWNITYLIDNDGNMVHSWENELQPGQSCYLLPDGTLLRTCSTIPRNEIFPNGGAGGGVQLIDWDGSILWNYECSATEMLSHHDVEMMPSGNILVIIWDYKSESEAIANGRNPSLLADSAMFPDRIAEIEPTGSEGGTIVWQWSSWDHIIQDFDPTKANYGVIADNPGKLDINYVRPPGNGDWLHTNSVDYNEELDQIILSNHNFNEIFIIDHSTADYDDPEAGIALAAGEAGDIIYRWGNPAAYDNGFPRDRILFGQHDAQWIEDGLPGEGNILIYNNGNGRTPSYSSIVEIVPSVDAFGNYAMNDDDVYLPEDIYWEYTSSPSTWFYSGHISGTQRLPNGNTLICSGASGFLFEVTNTGEIVWEYRNPVDNEGPQYQGMTLESNSVFRCYRYPLDYAAFDGHDLTPTGTIERYEMFNDEQIVYPNEFNLTVYPNPFNSTCVFEGNGQNDIKIFDISGNLIELLENGEYTFSPDNKLPSGVYFAVCIINSIEFSQKILYLK